MCVGLINAQIHYVAPRNGRPGGPMGQILDDIDAERANVEHLRQRSIREIKRAIRQREDLENDRLEETLTFAAVAASHPITVARALMQFGFEPFEKTAGSKYYFFGSTTLFFPNLFSYNLNEYYKMILFADMWLVYEQSYRPNWVARAHTQPRSATLWLVTLSTVRQLYTTRGFLTLLTGLDSAICTRFFSSIIDSAVWNMMDNFVGEVNTDLRKNQSLANSVRIAVKLVVTDCMVKIITRPFKVVMLRQIACIIENRAVFSTLQGIEYGWKAGWTDLYTGLSTELRNVLLGAFITFVCRHTVNKMLFNYYVKYKERGVRDPEVETTYKLYLNTMNKITELVLSPVIQCTIGCPFEVIAKTRAIAGTMLMDRIPSYCRDHHGAWNFLSSQNALFRGCTWFFRSAAI